VLSMTSTLLTTALMLVMYIAIVRFVDMNEKEPLWAMLLFFVVGAALAAALTGLQPAELELSVMPSAAAQEVVRFLAIGAGVAALAVIGQIRGWQEFNGTMDGVVYGTTAGLGFGTGKQLVSELMIGTISLPGVEVGVLSGFGTALLGGLAHGVFGAIIGAGIGAAADTRSPLLRGILPAFGLGAAIVAHVLHGTLGRGNAFGGNEGLIRSQIALFMPLFAIALVAGYALWRERRAIRIQLEPELSTGAVTAEELALLKSVARRETAYLKALLTFQLGTLATMKSLHNRQVQLAFTKDQAARESDPARRARLDTEINNLRAAIASLRHGAVAGQAGVA
jgi:protease PrsW